MEIPRLKLSNIFERDQHSKGRKCPDAGRASVFQSKLIIHSFLYQVYATGSKQEIVYNFIGKNLFIQES